MQKPSITTPDDLKTTIKIRYTQEVNITTYIAKYKMGLQLLTKDKHTPRETRAKLAHFGTMINAFTAQIDSNL